MLEYELSPNLSIDYKLPNTNTTFFLINISRLVEEDEEELKEVREWLDRVDTIDRQSQEWKNFVEKSIEKLISNIKLPHTQIG